MENKTIIYVVTHGEWESYNICALFSREDEAKHYIEEKSKQVFFPREKFRIQEWPLDIDSGCKSVEVFNSKISLQTGKVSNYQSTFELDTELESIKSQVVIKDSGLDMTRWAAFVKSSISQEHANELVINARRKWLKLKGTKPHEE